MKYDLVLRPAPGPGLGHVMRAFALAECAVEMEAKVVVHLLEQTTFRWPCPTFFGTAIATMPTGRVGVTDGKRNDVSCVDEMWTIIDSSDDGHSARVIWPHFGAEPINGCTTFYGPEWMPLRRCFRVGTCGTSGTLIYRAPESLRGMFHELSGSEDTERLMRLNKRLIAPASVIAYEGNALGMTVAVFRASHVPERIRTAMIAEGAARGLHSDSDSPVRKIVDGHGARRLLSVLL